MRAFLLSSCLAVTALVASQQASAADVYNEITLNQLEAVLSKSFKVTRDNTATGVILYVEGKDNLIGAAVNHCGGKSKCEGVEFWAPLDRKFSLSQANEFNRTHDYVKIVVPASGKAAVWNEVLTLGGLTAENINYQAAVLMLREDEADTGLVAQSVGGSNTAMLALGNPAAGMALLGMKAFAGTSRESLQARGALRQAHDEAKSQ